MEQIDWGVIGSGAGVLGLVILGIAKSVKEYHVTKKEVDKAGPFNNKPLEDKIDVLAQRLDRMVGLLERYTRALDEIGESTSKDIREIKTMLDMINNRLILTNEIVRWEKTNLGPRK